MISKERYRYYFLKWKKYVRYAPILDEIGIPRSNFSQFLSGTNNNAISVEKLQSVKNRMEELFEGIEKEDLSDGESEN